MKSIEELNNIAISELTSNGDYSKAKKLLIANAKKNPSYITYNNLAWYYFKIEELNPFIYDLYPFNKSTKYCMKALELKENLPSLRLLRNIHYAQKKYMEAKGIQDRIFESFENELDRENYIDDHYFMGCIFMGLEDYGSAEKYLIKAYDYFYSQKNSSYFEEFVTCALCLVKLGKYEEANKIGDNISDESIDLILKLIVYYYTNNYENIKVYIDRLQQEWEIQEDVLAIILLTYKYYYSKEEVEKKYIDLIANKKEIYKENGWKIKDKLILLEKVYKQINIGIKPEIKHEPFRYFLRNYIKLPVD